MIVDAEDLCRKPARVMMLRKASGPEASSNFGAGNAAQTGALQDAIFNSAYFSSIARMKKA